MSKNIHKKFQVIYTLYVEFFILKILTKESSKLGCECQFTHNCIEVSANCRQNSIFMDETSTMAWSNTNFLSFQHWSRLFFVSCLRVCPCWVVLCSKRGPLLHRPFLHSLVYFGFFKLISMYMFIQISQITILILVSIWSLSSPLSNPINPNSIGSRLIVMTTLNNPWINELPLHPDTHHRLIIYQTGENLSRRKESELFSYLHLPSLILARDLYDSWDW